MYKAASRNLQRRLREESIAQDQAAAQVDEPLSEEAKEIHRQRQRQGLYPKFRGPREVRSI